MASLWKWKIEASAPERADRAILKAIEEGLGAWDGDPVAVSRSQIQRLIEEGHVLVDGRAARAGEKLRPGSSVEASFPAPRALEALPEDRPIDILFQDAHLAVVNKPPGLTVHPSETQTEGTLVNILLHHLRDLSGIGGKLRPGIVHRIDKDTSGALVITKTDEAHRRLAETFARHDIERAYWALCYGSPATKSGRVEGQIGRNPTDRKKMALLKSGGRSSASQYTTIEEFSEPRKKPFASWLEVGIETGRTHQIRVHLTSLGHSILGDPVYGTPTERQTKWLALPASVREAVAALPGQALHARVLGFAHPITGEKLRFEAEPPPGFQKVIRSLFECRRVDLQK